MEPVSRPAGRPYARSWIDPALDWIERLPGPAWAFYLGFWIVAIAVVSAVRWLDGSLPFAKIDVFQAASTFYAPAALGLLHLLRRVAGSSLQSFRPALDIGDDDYARLHYQLTAIPAGPALVATLIGLVAAAAAVRVDSGLVSTETAPAATMVIVVVIYWAVVLIPILLYNTVRQLQLVTRVHRLATRIDLFEPRPLYAFSALSASAGVGLLLFNYYSALTDPTTFTNPIWYGVFGISVIVAIAFFVLPLYGMHRRIAAEKDRLESESGERVRTVISALHRQVDRGDLGDADQLNKTFASLALEREVLDKMPTWPWQPDTVRGFITALVVPVVLWLITRVLERIAVL
ncbi:MAG: hypothetical protein H0U86_11530 [Chloroflexi bacterium]|nr:hypothetical protein [Chloroflexota bacterium]